MHDALRSPRAGRCGTGWGTQRASRASANLTSGRWAPPACCAPPLPPAVPADNVVLQIRAPPSPNREKRFMQATLQHCRQSPVPSSCAPAPVLLVAGSHPSSAHCAKESGWSVRLNAYSSKRQSRAGNCSTLTWHEPRAVAVAGGPLPTCGTTWPQVLRPIRTANALSVSQADANQLSVQKPSCIEDESAVVRSVVVAAGPVRALR